MINNKFNPRNIKAMLIREEDLTNEIILKGNLVGTYSMKYPNVINVVKNRINGVTGKVPFSLWKELVLDLAELQKNQDKIDKDPQVKSQETQKENIDNPLDEVLSMFGFDKTKLKVLQEDLYKTIDKIDKDALQKDLQNGIEKVTDTFNTKNFKELFNDFSQQLRKEEEKIENERKAKFNKLMALRKAVVEEGLATKGFLKKINKKIREI